MKPRTQIMWTDYIKYRVKLRDFELAKVEHIVRFSPERYIDTATGRLIVVGQHGDRLVMIPYEAEDLSHQLLSMPRLASRSDFD